MSRLSRKKRALFLVFAVALMLFVMGLLFEFVSEHFEVKRVEKIWYEKDAGLVDFLILTAGDSHTEGAGAGPGEDYPAQLGNSLAAQNPSIRFDVVNIGNSGMNSTQILESVEIFLKRSKVKPKAILINGGFNNSWNFEHGSIFPEEIRKGKNVVRYVNYLLSGSHSYKFGKISVERLRRFARRRVDFTFEGEKGPIIMGQDPDEIDFLQRWVEKDVKSAISLGKESGAAVYFLSYWFYCDWVDGAFEKAGKTGQATFVDVRNFALPKGQRKAGRKWIAPGYHPNAEGYVRIAEVTAGSMENWSNFNTYR